jgi:hypothetical protein
LSVYVCVWYWGLSHSTSPFMWWVISR